MEALEKKDNKWKLALSDIKMFYRFSIIITLLHELQINQQNRIESPKINPNTFGVLIHDMNGILNQ